MLNSIKGFGVKVNFAQYMAKAKSHMPAFSRNFSSSSVCQEETKPTSTSNPPSPSTPASTSASAPRELIYEGRYWKSLRRIRRVSLGSCTTGLFVVPMGLLQHSDTLSVTGQLSILAVTVATCVGTTLGLRYLSHPYVAKIYAPAPSPASAPAPTKDSSDVSAVKPSSSVASSVYPCERLNIFGNMIQDEFDLNKITKTTAFDHPFCNFKYNGNFFYVATPQLFKESDMQKFDDKLA